jgi:hypothetical protein
MVHNGFQTASVVCMSLSDMIGSASGINLISLGWMCHVGNVLSGRIRRRGGSTQQAVVYSLWCLRR